MSPTRSVWKIGRWTYIGIVGVGCLACQPDWTELPVGGSDNGVDTSVSSVDSGEPFSTDDYGECDATQVDALTSYQQLIQQSGGEPVIVEQLYCVDSLDSAMACMACDSICEADIASLFSDEHRYDGWGYDLTIQCGPMWIDEQCCFVAQPLAWSE